MKIEINIKETEMGDFPDKDDYRKGYTTMLPAEGPIFNLWFGLYHEDGGQIGEVELVWDWSKRSPLKMEMGPKDFHLFKTFPEVFKYLAENTSFEDRSLGPEEVIKYLKEEGFEEF